MGYAMGYGWWDEYNAQQIQRAWRWHVHRRDEWRRLGRELLIEFDSRQRYAMLTDTLWGGQREQKRFDRVCAIYDTRAARRRTPRLRDLRLLDDEEV